MRIRRWRAIFALSVALVGALVPVGSANAASSSAGWSGYWYYGSASDITLGMAIPAGRLSGSVLDDGSGARSLRLTVTDAVPGDGNCPFLQILSQAGAPVAASVATCAGSTAININMVGEQYFYLCMHYYDPPGAGSDCNRMRLPQVATTIRATGTGMGWGYSTVPDQQRTFTWWAQIPGIQAYGDGSYSTSLGNATWTMQGVLDTRYSTACASADLYQQGSTSNRIAKCGKDIFNLGPLSSGSPRFRLSLCRFLTPLAPSQCIEGFIA
ncbi:MAG: hypothetical protein QOE58_929 [Actinomycetota bacterium]|jgi:hypothetical protein|nr:hypothetical protein [Actinomycetota bacterium]